MVDTIADKEYTKLVSNISPNLSWASFIDAEAASENACLGVCRLWSTANKGEYRRTAAKRLRSGRRRAEWKA